MFDRIFVVRNKDNVEYFIVPNTISVISFIEKVQMILSGIERYNNEIESVRCCLETEMSSVCCGDKRDITIECARHMIEQYNLNHPKDQRSVVDVILDAGAVSLIDIIPKDNILVLRRAI